MLAKQILARQSSRVKAAPYGFLDIFAPLPRLVCRINVLNAILRFQIFKHYPGIEPSTFEVAIGVDNQGD
jgi:hypothetical protein